MRTIEKNIIQVLEELKDANYMTWDNFTLSVRDSIYKDRETIQYKLWNNIIFNYFNLGGFYQKNYVIYWVNNESTKIEVDTNKKYKIVFFDKHAVKIEIVNE